MRRRINVRSSCFEERRRGGENDEVHHGVREEHSRNDVRARRLELFGLVGINVALVAVGLRGDWKTYVERSTVP